MVKWEDFQRALEKSFNSAYQEGKSYVDIRASDLHREVGGYLGTSHRMPVCCSVMRKNMQEGDEVLYEPPSGQGASLTIRYYLPRKPASQSFLISSPELDKIEYPKEQANAEFENIARKVMSEHFGMQLTKGRVAGIPKEFDMVSADCKIVGDAKYLTMVHGVSKPPAKFSMIAEYVWLLEKSPATHKFLVFGHDRRVPQEWLKVYGHLVKDVAFYFLDENGKLEKLN
jgi:hypothetical protein